MSVSYTIDETDHRRTLYPSRRTNGIVETTSVSGPGVATRHFVLLGEYERANVTLRDGSVLSVISPVAGDDPAGNVSHWSSVLDRTSAHLDIGPTVSTLHWFIVVPRTADESGSPAYNDWLRSQGATTEGFVYAQEGSGPGTWIHEYVHVRQQFKTLRDARWITEGLATYLGQLLTYELGFWSVSEFRQRLNYYRDDGGTLSDPSTWNGRTKYRKGSTVMAYLDQRIREETDGERTLIDVFRELNEHSYVSHEILKDAVAAVVGDRRLDDEIDRYVTTDANPANHEYLYVVGEDPGITVTPTPTVSPTATTPQSVSSTQDEPTSSGPSRGTSDDEGSTSTSPGLGVSVVVVALLLSIALSYRRSN